MGLKTWSWVWGSQCGSFPVIFVNIWMSKLKRNPLRSKGFWSDSETLKRHRRDPGGYESGRRHRAEEYLLSLFFSMSSKGIRLELAWWKEHIPKPSELTSHWRTDRNEQALYLMSFNDDGKLFSFSTPKGYYTLEGLCKTQCCVFQKW